MSVEKISIITVSKDAAETISNTIESVIAQTYDNIEVIFIDGDSKDDTNVVIDSYKSKIVERGYGFIHISESDAGIYDAMNKGIDYASGDWIYFLNADDKLVDKEVISRVFADVNDVSCIYGNTINVLDGERCARKGLPMDLVYYHTPFGHQALFVRRKIIVNYLFNDKWRYLADFDQVLRMYLKNEKFLYKDIDIAEFSLSGVSQKHIIRRMIEREKIQRENGVDGNCRLKRYVRNAAVIMIKGNPVIYKQFVRARRVKQIILKR